MIVVDTSALVAILWDEPEQPVFSALVVDADAVLIAAPTRLEAFAVCLKRRGLANAEAMERLLAGLGVVTAPFDEHQFVIASDAYVRYGRGRLGLNYGDCFSYALAKSRGLPLLFKGDDFRATDVDAAV